MSFTEKILEALRTDDDTLEMTLEDVRAATIREVLLYYTYTTITGEKWRLDFRDVPVNNQGEYIEFETDHDVLSVACVLAGNMWMRMMDCVSEQAELEIVEYSMMYGIQFDKKIERLFRELGIYQDNIAEDRKQLVLNIHTSVKSARSANP